MTDPSTLRGGCLCGSVRFEVTGPSTRVVHCHCGMCRRHSGAAFLTYAAYPAARTRFLQGAPVGYRSSVDATRSHCGTCGSPLTFRFDADPDTLWIALGAFDEPGELPPVEHWYWANRVPWLHLEDGLPRHPGLPEG